MTVKAILFDFDGVLTIDKTGSTTITNYIAKKSGIPLELIKSCYYKYNKRLLYGELTHEDMWSDFCEDVGCELDNLSVKASECFFIDNTAKNLIVPEKMGMQTILFDDENRDFDLFLKKVKTMIL